MYVDMPLTWLSVFDSVPVLPLFGISYYLEYGFMLGTLLPSTIMYFICDILVGHMFVYNILDASSDCEFGIFFFPFHKAWILSVGGYIYVLGDWARDPTLLSFLIVCECIRGNFLT